MAAEGAWPVTWAPYGDLWLRSRSPRPHIAAFGCVAGLLDPVWQPWGRGRSPEPRTAAVGAWPVPCASYGHREGVAGPSASYGRRWGVAGPLGLV